MGHSIGIIARRTCLGFTLFLAAPFAGAAFAQDGPPPAGTEPPAEAKPPAGAEPETPQGTVGILGVLRPGSGRPDPFTLQPDTGLEPLTVVQTRPIELTGFDGPLLLSVEGGIDVIVVHNDRAFRRRQTLVMPGDVIVLSARSPLDFDTTEEITFAVGSYTTPWIISTRRQDRTPWAFEFPPASDLPPGEIALSDVRPLRGFEGTIEARVSGPGDPRLRLNDGPWQPDGTAAPGDRIQLSAAAPPAGQRIVVSLTVGDLQVQWEVAAAGETAEIRKPIDR